MKGKQKIQFIWSFNSTTKIVLFMTIILDFAHHSSLLKTLPQDLVLVPSLGEQDMTMVWEEAHNISFLLYPVHLTTEIEQTSEMRGF